MGYSVETWEVDFRVPPHKVAAALADINASAGLKRPCWNLAHRWPNNTSVTVAEHDCQRDKPWDSLTEAVEELTGFHDCQEDDGFGLGWHLPEKWRNPTEDLLYLLGKYATEGSYVRLMGEDNELFGYRVVNGELREESATVTWEVVPVWPRKAQ